jgi:hypothetical protein
VDEYDVFIGRKYRTFKQRCPFNYSDNLLIFRTVLGFIEGITVFARRLHKYSHMSSRAVLYVKGYPIIP